MHVGLVRRRNVTDSRCSTGYSSFKNMIRLPALDDYIDSILLVSRRPLGESSSLGLCNRCRQYFSVPRCWFFEELS